MKKRRKGGKEKREGKEGEDFILLLPLELNYVFRIFQPVGGLSFLTHQKQKHQAADQEIFTCVNAFCPSPFFKPGPPIPNYSQLLPFKVVIFCKVTMTFELVDTEFISREPQITTFSRKEQYISLFYVCFYLKTLYIFFSQFINIDLTSHSTHA